MIVSEKKFHSIQQILLILIASTIFFRLLCTLLILFFSVFSIVHYKYLSFTKKQLLFIALISVPLLLEIFFLWNNNSLQAGMKSLEKNLSLLILPVFIIGNATNLNFIRIITYYRYLTTIILLFLMIRFVIISPHLMQKYLNGIHLWEMGYMFTNSFKNHAPAVNMHIAFLTVVHVYFLLWQRQCKCWLINTLLLLITIFALFFVNTRISLATTVIGIFFIIINFLIQKNHINYQKIFKIGFSTIFLTAIILFVAFRTNPYMKEKYGKATFAYMDKVGRLDEIENPETKVFNAFVTRVSIWKSAWELGRKNPFIGYGSSDGKRELVSYFKQTNQKFLAKYEFPVHNQPLDYFLKYGIFGLLSCLAYLIFPVLLGYKTNKIIIAFFGLNFLLSNMFDDFLIRFDGIVFYGLWVSLAMADYFRTASE